MLRFLSRTLWFPSAPVPPPRLFRGICGCAEGFQGPERELQRVVLLSARGLSSPEGWLEVRSYVGEGAARAALLSATHSSRAPFAQVHTFGPKLLVLYTGHSHPRAGLSLSWLIASAGLPQTAQESELCFPLDQVWDNPSVEDEFN